MSKTETRDAALSNDDLSSAGCASRLLARRAQAQRLRPEALQCVERLKDSCREEARENRERAARTIAAFANPLPPAPAWRSPTVRRGAEHRPR